MFVLRKVFIFLCRLLKGSSQPHFQSCLISLYFPPLSQLDHNFTVELTLSHKL